MIKDRVDSKKPRAEGLTYIIDKFQGVDKESFELVSPFVDMVKIYGALPLLVSETTLKKRIKFYHDIDVYVSTDSTIAEVAILENSVYPLAKKTAEFGFDVVELGENNIDLDIEDKKKLVDIITSHGLEFQWKVGKKDPRHQLSIEETLNKIDQALNLGSKKVLLEANEGSSVGIYDEKGVIKWNFIGALTAKYPPNSFIFEAPIESQQSALIAEFGQRVNLAEICSDAIMSVESQRRGFLSKSVFGVSNLRKDPEGGPAAKFMYYIIKTKYPIDQSELTNISHLPRRTVQAAVEDLKRQGLIIERNSLDDARKKMYHPVHSDWL
ncbi:MAG: phosphosulfolactate synthase [Thermoproteota archaeon]|jgi:phosphosulfolactate synthase|nr:phosphosulfolactate synthase [Thermoproteota archaeon]